MNSPKRDAVDRLLDAVPEPAHDAAAAAMTSYVHSPSDDVAALQAVQQVMGCEPADAEAFLARYGGLVREAAAEYVAKTREFGLEGAELASLEAAQTQRAAELNRRASAFYKELASLVPPDKTAGEALSDAQVDVLRTKHGLAVGPDGQLALAADAGE